MTLLITMIAAVICTIIWYKKTPNDYVKISELCFMYWGASLMWLVDAVFEYAELRSEFFTPPIQDIVNDTFLGFSVITLGLVIWSVRLLISDPKNVFKKVLLNKK